MMNEFDGRTKKIRRDDGINYSAQVFGCQDLFSTILLQFPARFLVTLKLVSKQFRYAISDPLFCINHVHLHHPHRESLSPTSLYFYTNSPQPEIYHLSLSNPPKPIPSLSTFPVMAFLLDRQFKIVQSCSGLLLCSFDNASSRLYFVCNPTTLAFTMLPPLPRIQSSSSKSKKIKNPEEAHPPVLTLAFNPLQTHVYKVFGVRIVKQVAQKSSCELMVYSSEEGDRAWRKSPCEFSIPARYNQIQHGVFHDGGKITWICERGFVQFDVQAAKVIEVKKRSSRSSTWENLRFFGEGIDGTLQLIKRRPNSGIDVNQLMPETSKWERREKHHLRQFLWTRHGVRSDDMYRILAVGDGGKCLILAIPGKVIRYCKTYRNSVVLGELPQPLLPQEFSFGCVNSFQFVETLSPV